MSTHRKTSPKRPNGQSRKNIALASGSRPLRRKKVEITWRDVLGFNPDHPLLKSKKKLKRRRKEKGGPHKRKLRFEEMEQRLALSADPMVFMLEPPPEIDFGLVYFEDDMSMGKDQGGDVFQINWTGGAEGTTLAEIRINLDKNQNGKRDPGEGFFDTEGLNGGVYGSFPFQLVSKENVGAFTVEVEDGGQLLVIKFTDFQPGGKFVFSIDVDEWGEGIDGSPNPNAIFEGAEIEGSLFTAVFEHPGYEIGQETVHIVDRFDDPAEKGLDLPSDGYGSSPSKEIQTAAGIGSFQQVPKKGSLSGFVYEDLDNSGTRDSGEKGIPDVELSLWVWDGAKYVETGLVARTDSQGSYKFENLDPFCKYRITERQPTGYIDGTDSVGSLGGEAENPGDTIGEIPLGPNEHGTDYNFGELKTGSLSGHVYEDYNCDGKYQESEIGIPDVVLTLWVWDGEKYVNTGITRTTDSKGAYKFDQLDPFKKYQITEKNPPGYFEGKEQVGSLGGTALTPPENTITDILVGFDQHGVGYNFAERLPSSLSGYVYEDVNDDGIRESGERGIEDVELTLYVKNTTTGKYESTGEVVKTDEKGYYSFVNLDPCKLYAVHEKQPDGFLDGKDTPGPNGGTNPENDVIEDIDTVPGEESGENNFGERKPSSLNGYVFQDGDTVHLYPDDPEVNIAPPQWNGQYEDGVKPIGGVVLILADAKGVPLKDAEGNLIKVKTNAQGYYEFTMLPEGTYSILQEQPEGYIDGIDTPGSTGGSAINAYDEETLEELRNQGIDVESFKNDAIISIPLGYAQNSVMNNFSEVEVLRDLVPPEPPLPPEDPYTPPPTIPFFNPDGPRGASGSFAPGGYHYTPSPHLSMYSSPAGGGGIPESNYTWHLSIVNGGYPRGEGVQNISSEIGALSTSTYTTVSWKPISLMKGKWIIRDKYGKAIEKYTFGLQGSRPVVGDFSGDGIANIAIFYDGYWYIDLNGNGIWDEEDMIAYLGTGADQPIVGDWDGDGKADIGIFGPQWEGDEIAIQHDPGLPSDLNTRVASRPKNVPPSPEQAPLRPRALQHTARGNLRFDVIDHVFEYGKEGDIAFSGDFTGDGITNIGVYKDGNIYIDLDGDGRWDPNVDLMIPKIGRFGEVPVVGDFNGDGIDEIGMFKDGYWRLDTTGDYKLDTEIQFGEIGDSPVVGDFTGDGYAQLGVYRPFDGDAESLLTEMNTIDGSPKLGVPNPQYGDQYGGGSQEKVLPMKSETVQGGLPEDISNRPERTMHTPHTSDPAR